MEVDDDFYIDEPDPFYVDDPLNGGESSDSTQEQPLFVKKGDMINSQCRQLIANVAAFMKKEAELYKTTMQIIIPIINHKERVLAATGISSGVYCRIMNEAEAEELASDVLEPTPRHGLKRKHEDSTEVLDKHGDDAVENVPDFQIKEEITPESTLADELIIKTSHSELSLIKEEINLDGAEGEKCPTPETVYIPGFYIEDPERTNESAKNTTFDMLPAKSKEQYETQYNKFSQWCSETKVENLTENVLLEYFSEQSKTFKSSTLWAHYSMLKATIAMKRNININQFPKLTEYLKRISQGYQAKKSKTFTRAQVNTFLLEAPDECYLLMKVVLIIGLAGACRRDELQRMSLDDVQDVGSILIINIPDSRTKVKRTFTISNGNVQSLEIYRKYRSLRPASCNNKHLFLSYYSGKCKKQHVGVNTFGKIPSLIATYLKLPNPKAYTAHCLKRTSAALLVENKLELARRRRRGFEPDETVPVSTTSETCPVPSTSQNNIRANGEGCDINDQNLEPMKQEDDSRTAEENSDDSGDEECLSTPPEILNNLDKATATISNLLPVNSQELYEKEYEIFTEWKKKNKVGAVSESVIFNYFFEKSKVLKPSSLWSKFSMLRLTMELKDSVNIAKFPKLMTFLKRYSAGYKPKKSKTLTKEEIIRFLTEAPDEIYLLMKTALILGIFGACRRVELTNMNIDNIQDRGSVLIVHIPDIKARTERTFTVGGKIGELDPIEIYRKYVALRPKHTTHRRLFVNYRGGKCTVQVVGINTFAKIPSLIAKYLEIPDYASYTGHCLRRTSASLLSDSGVMVAGNFNPLR